MTGAAGAGTLDGTNAVQRADPGITDGVTAPVEEVRIGPAANVAAVEGQSPVRFLAQPSWNAGMIAVASVLSPYVRAFWPDEAVSLVLVLPSDDPRSLADAERLACEAIEACGRSLDEVPAIVIARARSRSSLLPGVDVVAATDRALVETARRLGLPVIPLARSAFRAAFGDAVERREFERVVPMLRVVCVQAAAGHPRGSEVLPLLETFVDGYRRFLASREVSQPALAAMQALVWLTDGQVGGPLAALWTRAHPPYDITPGSAFLGEAEITRVVAEVVEAGVAVLPGRFPAAARAQLAIWAQRTADLTEPALLTNRAARAFAMDLSTLAVAQGVLGCAPVLSGIEMRRDTEPVAEAETVTGRFGAVTRALNAFEVIVFLTPPDGTVRFVRGSHRGRPIALRRAEALDAEDVAAAYGHENVVPVVGPAGTIVLADGRCLRSPEPRGSAPSLTLTACFSASLFGAPASPVPFERDAAGGFPEMVDRCPRTYARYHPA